MAFFSSDFYKDVGSNWKGCGALYIFLLTTVAWIIGCVAMFAPMVQLMNNKEMSAFLDQMPKMTIVDGKLSIDKQGPYEIRNPKNKDEVIALFALDRTTDELKDTDPAIVVTSEKVLMRADAAAGSKYKTASSDDDSANGADSINSAQPILKFSELNKSFGSIECTGKNIEEMINTFLLWVPIGIFVIGWPMVFLGHLFQLLIYGAIGGAIASGMYDKKISFETSMRLAAMAVTPCVMITVVLQLVRMAVPAIAPLMGIWAFCSIAVAAAYLFLAMKWIEAPAASTVR